jgi:hypothetical protein
VIDWLAASRCLAALTERAEATSAVLREAVEAAPCFQNAPFPVAPLPLFAERSAVTAVVPAMESYLALIQKIIRLYCEHGEIRQWYGLGPSAEQLIGADRRLGDAVVVCRLDGYLEQGSEHLYLLENNADSPAGTLFSARINQLVREVLERAGVAEPGWSPLTFSAETALLDTLLGTLAGAGLSVSSPRVAVLQFTGRANRESGEMAEAFRAAGVDAFVADPRAVEVSGGRVSFGGERADICWNKVNTVGWRLEVESDPDLVRRWLAAVACDAFVNVNPFGARYVAESKFALALIREPRFESLFTQAERDLAATHLPWARRLFKDALAEDGTPLHADVLDHPSRYVIKEPYDIRGDGVTVGLIQSASDWQNAIARALDRQLVVQRYVRPTPYPVVRMGETPAVVAMPTSFDTYILGGAISGFGAKASLHARVNVFQGGQKLAVHVV